jgi:hypothetical protein
MATVVLVHGSSCGSPSRERLIPFPRAAGHEVSSPGQTRLGERIRLAFGLTYQRERRL